MDQTYEVRSKARLLFWCINANLGAFISGIFFTAFNACLFQVLAALKVHPENQNIAIASLSAIIPFGGIAGGILSSLLAVKFERRKLMIATDLLTVVACIMSQSTFFFIMLVGRALCGFVCGANFMLVPLYVREMSPQHFGKGTAILFRGMFALGACLSFFMGYFSQKPPGEINTVWVGVALIPMLFAVIRMLLLTFVARLDTPTFYIKHGDSDKAWKIINQIYHDGCLDSVYRKERRYSTHFKFKDIFSHEYRGQVRLAILIIIFAQLMGGNIMNFYSTQIFFGNRPGVTEQDFRDVGFLNLFSACVTLFSSLLGFVMLQKIGKRPLLIYGGASLIVLSLLVAFSELVSFAIGQATLVNLFVFVQNLTFNLVASAYAYELLPSYSLVLQVVGEMIGMLGMVFVFPLIGIELNFVIYAVMSGLGFVIAFKLVKETKGMTDDEIHRLFQSQSKGLLDDEVTLPSNSLTAIDDLHDHAEESRLDLSQRSERHTPVY